MHESNSTDTRPTRQAWAAKLNRIANLTTCPCAKRVIANLVSYGQMPLIVGETYYCSNYPKDVDSKPEGAVLLLLEKHGYVDIRCSDVDSYMITGRFA